jgi:hypothetical protein
VAIQLDVKLSAYGLGSFGVPSRWDSLPLDKPLDPLGGLELVETAWGPELFERAMTN